MAQLQSTAVTGSLIVTQGITGSLFGTSSWAISSSYALTSSYGANFTASNLLVTNTVTAQTLVVQTITSSVEYSSGSNVFGSLLTNTHQFTGSVSITGSLTVNNNTVLTSNQTSSMSVNSSSFAATSSNVLGGTANYLPIWNTNTSLSSSALYQSTGNIGLGTTSLTGYNIRVSKNITGAVNSSGIMVESAVQSDVTGIAYYYNSYGNTQNTAFTLGNLIHYYANATTSFSSATVTNQIGFYAANGLTGATNNYGFFGSIASGSGRYNLYMNGTADNYLAGNLGIGTTSLTNSNLKIQKNITGNTIYYNVFSGGTVQSDVTSQAVCYVTLPTTQATTFTLSNLMHFYAVQQTFGASSTVTNQYGYAVDSSLTGATFNYGFYGNIPIASGRYNLYMAGTADNFLGGSLGIGTTSLTNYSLRIDKSITGGTTSFQYAAFGTVQSDVTVQARYFATSAGTAAAAFTASAIYHYFAQQTTIGAGSVVTSQYAYYADSTITGATNNYGFYGNLASGSGRWNLYMGGTAQNYLAGVTLIGTTALQSNIPSATLDVNGLIRARSGIQIMGDNTITPVISASRSDNSQYGTLVYNGWGDFAFNKSLYLGYTPQTNNTSGNGYLFAQGGIGINKTGSLNGSFDVNGGATISGSLTVTQGISGSHFGTSSWAISSSYALTASYWSGTAVSASYAATASWALNFITSSVTSASYSATASFVTGSIHTAGNLALSSSYAVTASYWSGTVVSSSYAGTSSNINGGTANYIPIWNSATTLSSSAMYQSSSTIGLGTVAPSRSLHIVGGNDTDIRLTSTAGYVGLELEGMPASGSYIDFTYPGQDYSGRILYDNVLRAMRFSNSGSSGLVEVMTITGSSVGIGTPTPGYKLDVNGSAAITGTGYVFQSVNNTTGYLYFDHAGTQVWKQGVFNDNTSTFAIGTGAGFSRLFNITNTGNVGIGTTSPSDRLHVETSNEYQITWIRTSTSKRWALGSDTLGTYISNRTDSIIPLYITNTGNVGIGTTSPSYKLSVYDNKTSITTGAALVGATAVYTPTGATSNVDSYAQITSLTYDLTAGAYSGASNYNASSLFNQVAIKGNSGTISTQPFRANQTVLVAAGGTAMNIADFRYFDIKSPDGTLISGNVVTTIYGLKVAPMKGSSAAFTITNGWGIYQEGGQDNNFFSGSIGVAVSPTYKLDINATGSYGARIFSGSLAVGNITPSATVGRIDASNDIVAYSSSDKRFKTNLKPISEPIEKITQIGGYEFDWLENPEHHGNKGHDIGVIAQEIENVLPEIVTTRDSGYKAVKYEKIVPLLIEAIKDQQKQIDELKYLLQNK